MAETGLRRILAGSAAYSVAFFAGRAASILLLPVYTRYVIPAEYGVLELLSAIQNALALVLGSRLGQAIFYFHSKSDDQDHRDSVLSTAYVGAGLTLAFTLGMACLASPYLNSRIFGNLDYVLQVRLSLVALAFQFPLEIGQCCLRALDKQRDYVLVNLASITIAIVVNVAGVVVFKWGINAFLFSSIVTSLASSVWIGWRISQTSRWCPRMRLLGEMTVYSLPLTGSSLAEFFLHFGDRFFLNRYVSLAELGIYSVAYKIGMVVAMIHSPFMVFWNAQMFTIMRDNVAEDLHVRLTSYIAIALTSVAVLLALFASPIIALFAAPAYRGASRLVPLLALAYLLRAIAAYVRSTIMTSGRTKTEAHVNIAGAIGCLIGYVLLVPIWKVWGAVWATLLAFVVILAHSWIVTIRWHAYSFEYVRLFRLFMVASTCVAVSYVIPDQTSLIRSILTDVALAILYFGGLLLSKVISNDEMRMIKQLLPFRRLGFGLSE